MLFSYKFFTFSQFPNKFYISKSTTTHTPAPTENPSLFTQNPPPHNTKHHHPHHHQKKKKSEIKERKQIYEWRRQDREEIIWPRGGRGDLEGSGDDQTQFKNQNWEREEEERVIANWGKGRRRSRKREIGHGWVMGDKTGQATVGFMWRNLDGTISTM